MNNNKIRGNLLACANDFELLVDSVKLQNNISFLHKISRRESHYKSPKGKKNGDFPSLH